VLIDQPTDVKDALVFDKLMFVESDYTRYVKKPDEGFSMRRRRPTHRERPSLPHAPKQAQNNDQATADKTTAATPDKPPPATRPPDRRPRPREP
jgi:hypothetical protein